VQRLEQEKDVGAVTASSCTSSPTQISSPVGASRATASARSSSVTAARANSPAMPWPISAGVFGMTRMTRSLPVAATMVSLRTPAMTLTCSAPAT